MFTIVAVGATSAIAMFMASRGWTISSPQWNALAPLAMWAPAFARFVARRMFDREFASSLPMRRWGVTGARVVLRPLAFPLLVYGAAYAIALATGFAYWNPGAGKWTTGSQIAANLVINLAALGVIGTFNAMGEEIGWRGYLQPRLDAAGVRWSLAAVWLVQVAYHAPLIIAADYVTVGGVATGILLFAIADFATTFIMAREAYLARSVWPAIFFHSFHNTISQWLFPKFFTVDANQIWLQGEDGVLPLVGYAVLAAAMYASMRVHGSSWRSLVDSSLALQRDSMRT